MANTRKIKCDCGKYLEEKEVNVDHILAKAMVCPSCEFTTLTKDQAVEFRKRVDFHQAIDQERKVIQIGNSFGITFPERLREFGVSVGSTVKMEALNEKSFKVEIA